jgi:TPP-dependent pyruvate/acetoin dehydrogenase alpha subunit
MASRPTDAVTARREYIEDQQAWGQRIVPEILARHDREVDEAFRCAELQRNGRLPLT